MQRAIQSLDMLHTTPGVSYQYTLGDWDNRSAVRSKESSYLLPPATELEHELQSKDWFPPVFIPYLEHLTIQQAGRKTQQRLAANHLVYFLNYTTILEHKIVNRLVETLIHDEQGIELPKAMKMAALQLYTDEAYHALFSSKLVEQVAHLYAVPAWHQLPKCIQLLQNLLGSSVLKYCPLTWFLVGFVSETIIAKELLSITSDILVSNVYQMFREHPTTITSSSRASSVHSIMLGPSHTSEKASASERSVKA